MEEQELFGKLSQAVFEGETETLVSLVKGAIDTVDPLAMVEKGMMKGMTEVGDKFSAGEVYLPELLMAADAWEEAMKIIKPKLVEVGASMGKRGTVVIGTVQTDIHEIGKNILGNLLTTAGFEVHDVGYDTPASKFLSVAEEVGADIIALSAIMSTTVPYQKDTIEAIPIPVLGPDLMDPRDYENIRRYTQDKLVKDSVETAEVGTDEATETSVVGESAEAEVS